MFGAGGMSYIRALNSNRRRLTAVKRTPVFRWVQLDFAAVFTGKKRRHVRWLRGVGLPTDRRQWQV